MNFTTAFSTNAVSICRACDIQNVTRIELSRRYVFETNSQFSGMNTIPILLIEFFLEEQVAQIINSLHDKMTEYVYTQPITSFASGAVPKLVKVIPVLSEGRYAFQFYRVL